MRLVNTPALGPKGFPAYSAIVCSFCRYCLKLPILASDREKYYNQQGLTMEYIVLKSWGWDQEQADWDLEEQVREHIHQGWRPIGGVSVASVLEGPRGPGILMAQAMTRE